MPRQFASRGAGGRGGGYETASRKFKKKLANKNAISVPKLRGPLGNFFPEV
jgi:hypothetical protein